LNVILPGKIKGVTTSCYEFKPDLIEDLRFADFVISHCGAGTVLEVLRLRKKACVVINSTLLGNHQTELADAIYKRNLALMCPNPSNLSQILEKPPLDQLEFYQEPKPHLFLQEISKLVRI
jgi:beta-1,4-N-acetylglucosaminyltransferase